MSEDLNSDALFDSLLVEMRTHVEMRMHISTFNQPPQFNTDIKSRNLSQSKFLSLPAEIRFRIYSYSLVSISPITVWSARIPVASRFGFAPRALVWDRKAMARDLRRLSIGLLRCSTSIAADAAHIFYRGNKFCFFGEHEYYPVITWLDKIGMENRECLRNLQISVDQPPRAWQLPDGSCLRPQYYSTINGYANRHPQLPAPALPCKEGEVDIINPAIETIISLLAGYSSARKVTLYLQLTCCDMPGVTLIEQEDMTQFSMDLPNLVEKWRTAYFSNKVCGSLEVIWIAESSSEAYIQKRDLIEDVGWEILQEEDVEIIQKRYRGPHEPELELAHWVTRSLLRRKPLIGPLMAADPDPYTDWYRKPRPSE